VEFDETYAPVVAMESVRFIMGVAATNGWKVDHLDVPTAFLNGEIEHLIVTKVPKGWNIYVDGELGDDGDPTGLDKSLYGAKQAGLCWNKVMHKSAIEFGFIRSTSDTCVYILVTLNGVVLFGIWTDDYFVTGNDGDGIRRWKAKLFDLFQIKDRGVVEFALGVRFRWDKMGLFMDQSKAIEELGEKHGMDMTKGKAVPIPPGTILMKDMGPKTEEERKEMEEVPYKSLIGSLLYIARVTRPDVMFAVSFMSRFASDPGMKHWEVLRGVLKYLMGTSQMGLRYRRNDSAGDGEELVMQLESWPDSSYNDDREKGRSTYGHVSYVGECAYAWQSTLSKTTPQSVFEGEIIAANEACKVMVGYAYICQELGGYSGTPIIHIDNDPAVFFAENAVHTKKSRHMMPKFYYIREQCEQGNVQMARTKSEDQHGDIMTKMLSRGPFEKFRRLMGVCSVEEQL
jgi:hypothetical protein